MTKLAVCAIEHDCYGQTHRISRRIQWYNNMVVGRGKGEPPTWKMLCPTLRDWKLNWLGQQGRATIPIAVTTSIKLCTFHLSSIAMYIHCFVHDAYQNDFSFNQKVHSQRIEEKKRYNFVIFWCVEEHLKINAGALEWHRCKIRPGKRF